jgi:hypothetical protein
MKQFFLAFAMLFAALVAFADNSSSSPASKSSQEESVQMLPAETAPMVAPMVEKRAEKPMAELKAELKKMSKEERKELKQSLKASIKQEKRPVHWANIVSIASAVGALFIPFAFLAAIVFGIIGITKSGSNKDFSGQGWGLAGLITGSLILLLYIVVVAIVGAALFAYSA